jgi:hypothetical protein
VPGSFTGETLIVVWKAEDRVLATADEHSLSFVESLPDGNATLSFQSADKVFSRTKVVQFLAHRKNLPPNLGVSKRKLENYKEIKWLFLAQKTRLIAHIL